MLGDVIYDVGLRYDIDFSSLWSFISTASHHLCTILGTCTPIRAGCVYIWKMSASELRTSYMLENGRLLYSLYPFIINCLPLVHVRPTCSHIWVLWCTLCCDFEIFHLAVPLLQHHPVHIENNTLSLSLHLTPQYLIIKPLLGHCVHSVMQPNFVTS